MRQKRICEYFGLPCTHFRTFLDFPVAVRRYIYELAGLIVDTTIPLLPGPEAAAIFGPVEESFDLTLSLLRVCKAVHNDVMAIIVSRNALLVLPTGLDYGLSFLRQLAPEHCYSITELHVHLHKQSEHKILAGKERFLKARHVTAWFEAAENVLANVKPQTLNLHLIYDSLNDTSQTATVIQPLLKFPGTLADCELRLSAKRETYLSTLALETASQATGDHTDPALRKGTFRFFDLPQELRRSILEFTDLVTPYQQVQWSPQTGFYCVFRLHYCQGNFCMEELHHGCRFRFCGWGVSREFARLDRSQSVCRARHSSYSSNCHCWMAPGYLMLVSRTMYHDAKAVFYSQNRIIIGQSKGVYLASAGSTIRLGASRFIMKHTWPDVLQHINTLELIFPPLETSRCHRDNDPAYLDWLFAVDHLAAHANISNLTLVMHIIHTTASRAIHSDQLELLQHPGASVNRKDVSPFRAYARLVIPLKALCRMKRFFVHLAAPQDPSPPESDYIGHSSFVGAAAQPGSRAYKIETQIEKSVMGDAYDSSAAGKEDEERARWLRGFGTFI